MKRLTITTEAQNEMSQLRLRMDTQNQETQEMSQSQMSALLHQIAGTQGEPIMNYNINVGTIITEARDGMKLVIHTATWLGRVIEVDTYRASDMAELEIKSLGAH